MEGKEVTVYQQQLTPDIWAMIENVALAAHESRKFGVSTCAEAAMKFLFCYENNLPLSTANTGLYVVNGRIAAQGNIIAAQLRRHPDYDYRIKEVTDKGCTITIMRRGPDNLWQAEGEASFTEDDAKRAGLLAKDNYRNYPSDMYFNRALARAQRRFAPNIFSQPVYTPEELGAKVGADGDMVIEGRWQDVIAPQPAPAAAAAKITLPDLVAQYGPQAVMAANGGAIPSNDEEVRVVADKLGAANA